MVIGACGSGWSGGSGASVDCSSEGEVFLDADGDAHVMNDANAGVVLGASDDTCFVGQDAVVGVLGRDGGTVDASNAWGSSVLVTNLDYPNENPMTLNMPGGGTLEIAPGSSVFHTFPEKPKI